MTKITRAALYERVSTDEQALRGFSIDAQIENLEQFCKDKDLRIVDHYTDAGVSGGKPAFRRPEMSRLLEDVKAGKIDIILFTKLDRWFRNIQEYFKVQEILEQSRVEWKAIHEDYDTTTANGRMAITIFLAIAQNEREKGSERIHAVLENKRKHKEACFGGGRSPSGYMKQKDENGVTRLVLDPETEPQMRDFWRIICGGRSITAAGKFVNEKYGLTRSFSQYSNIFNNELYRGKYKGIEDFCPAYISQADWERAKKSHVVVRAAKNRCYLFTGLMTCPGCGRMLTASYRYAKKGQEYFYYVCGNQKHGRCTFNRYVSEPATEAWLLQNIKTRLEAYIAEVEVAAAVPKPKRDTAEKVKEKIRRLNVVYMGGGKTDEEYISELSGLKAQLAAAELENEKDPKDKNLVELHSFLKGDFAEVYATLSREEKRELWRSIVGGLSVVDNKVVDIVFKS